MKDLSRRSTIFLRVPKPSSWQRSVASPASFQDKSRLSGIIPRGAHRIRPRQWPLSTPLLRSKSAPASQYQDVMPEHECEEGEHELGSDDHDEYTISIEDNGKAISIANELMNKENGLFEDNTITDATECNSWKFSSALLWVNDPQYIHASSGQRVRSLGQFSRDLAIVSARVFCIDGNGNELSRISPESDSALQNLHALPPQGSLHPRGGIYWNHRDGHATSNRRNLLRIEWNDGNETIYDLDWLMDHANNDFLGRPKDSDNLDRVMLGYHGHVAVESSRDTKPERTTRTTRVTKDVAIGRTENPNTASFAKFDYRDILFSEDALFAGMQEIFEHGAILIQNAPTVEDGQNSEEPSPLLESIVGDLGRRMSGGSLSHGSLYGDIFHVRNKANAENIAYTNVALPPHQDLVYYESKPFLQLLHCATKAREGAIVGGESTLIDAMAAAEELRRISPDLFEFLCRTEATFVKERHDSDMVSPKPHIVVDPAYGQVVEVNWSPPFEGPLQMHPRIAVEDYVRAYQAMECMLDDNLIADRDVSHSTFLPEPLESVLRAYAKEYTKEYTLQQGEVLVFNNQRMLHGRRSFRSFGSTERHLIGCYTDATDTLSRYRQLLRERKGKSGGGYGKRNPGSGCRWM